MPPGPQQDPLNPNAVPSAEEMLTSQPTQEDELRDGQGQGKERSGGASRKTRRLDRRNTTLRWWLVGLVVVLLLGLIGGALAWATRSLPVGSAPANDFALSASASALTVQQGGATAVTITSAVLKGSPQAITLSASGALSGVVAGFTPTILGGGASILTLQAGSEAPPEVAVVTISGATASVAHTLTVALTVTALPPQDFTLSVTPGSLVVAPGATATALIIASSGAGGAGSPHPLVPAGATARVSAGIAYGAGAHLQVHWYQHSRPQ
jgi:hypothetical protein